MPNRRLPSQRRARSSAVKRARSQPTKSQFAQLLDMERTHLGGAPPQIRDKTPMATSRNRVYTFVQTVDQGTLTPSLTLDVLAGYEFRLNQLATADLTAYQTLFDQYRLIEVQLQFVALNPSATEAPLYSCIDYDSSATATINQIEQYSTLQISQGQYTTIRTLSPRARLVAYTGATATQAANSSPMQWFDLGAPATSYFGVLVGIPLSAATSATPAYRVTSRFVMQFRNVR